MAHPVKAGVAKSPAYRFHWEATAAGLPKTGSNPWWVARGRTGVVSTYLGALHADLSRILTPLVAAMDLKDELYGIHSRRVADLAALLAQTSGVSGVDLEWVRLGALVHDVGKIGIPDHILKKPDRLTPAEFDVIKTHPAMGRLILSTVDGLPATILNIVQFHHERFDGKGYPSGLQGQQIPYCARLVAVADAWDAMTSKRAYRPPLPIERAVQQLIHGMNTQFDGGLVATFLHQIVPNFSGDSSEQPL